MTPVYFDKFVTFSEEFTAEQAYEIAKQMVSDVAIESVPGVAFKMPDGMILQITKALTYEGLGR